ncbi:MAG TPA: von Willebrand factor type A domain-containing protein [Kofleriaceae bacterium]|nr:von Willebrand factor type A domain-containing protein [Kofleriaceae bacterium]
MKRPPRVLPTALAVGLAAGLAAAPACNKVSDRKVDREPAVAAATPATTESYSHDDPTPWTAAAEDARSTFAIDVDTGSYTILRKKVMDGDEVPPDAVRVEELLNYFRYADAPPTDGRPFAIRTEVAPSPWRAGTHLMRVSLRGREVPAAERKPAHLVFLVDVSGSMNDPDKLPLVKQSLRVLVDSLNRQDTVSLVTYAGATRVVLEPTGMERRGDILEAIADLDAGGSTAMASGLDLAYQQASRTLAPGSVSRVIVLTDGDANVGPTSFDDMLSIIAGRAREGITLSTIGFGMGNYKDSLLEQLADRGDGNYVYVDRLAEAKRVFQEQLGGTIEVIAKDVKVQVELDPRAVARYRLVGYDNRAVADDSFRDDAVDGGEIGAGHAVTALYELELVPDARAEALGTVHVRAKRPESPEAAEWVEPIAAGAARSFEEASVDLRFAAAVMGAGEILRRSPHAEGWSLARARAIASASAAGAADRTELVALLDRLTEE